jgi:diguanylate cyclase (GGDEF)-like protein
MHNLQRITLVPTKLRYRLLVSFCLMSVLPLLIGVYIASLFIKFPFTANAENLLTISTVLLCSAVFSFLGYRTSLQMVHPIGEAAKTAKKIAENLDGEPEVKGEDELEALSRSLRTIHLNAKELLEKVERLSLKDKLTGLYNGTYIRERLHEEIQRAIHYQRPCAFAYFQLTNLNSFSATEGIAAKDKLLKSTAEIFNRELSEFDRAARVTEDEFAIILPDKNKKKTIEIVNAIRKAINEAIPQNISANGNAVKVCVGISENPIDGVTAQELFAKAQERTKAAVIKGADAIEAF